MSAKRRHWVRRRHSNLSPETRTQIERLLFQTRLTQVQIGLKCGVAQSRVSTIAREIGFKPWTRKSKFVSGARKTRNREIIRLATMGKTYAEIGQRYGITRQRAQQIVRLYGGEH
jgi:hypothetical protein